jgi:chaperonin GroEL
MSDSTGDDEPNTILVSANPVLLGSLFEVRISNPNLATGSWQLDLRDDSEQVYSSVQVVNDASAPSELAVEVMADVPNVGVYFLTLRSGDDVAVEETLEIAIAEDITRVNAFERALGLEREAKALADDHVFSNIMREAAASYVEAGERALAVRVELETAERLAERGAWILAKEHAGAVLRLLSVASDSLESPMDESAKLKATARNLVAQAEYTRTRASPGTSAPMRPLVRRASLREVVLVGREEVAQGFALSGVPGFADAVQTPLGTGGHSAVSGRAARNPVVMFNLAVDERELERSDKDENMRAQMVREVAPKDRDTVDDGTATAILIARAIYREGNELVTAGHSPFGIKRGIDLAVDAVVRALKQIAVPIGDWRRVREVATVLANGDAELGALLTAAMERVGMAGVISVEEAKSEETSVQIVNGLQFNQGYLSPYFVTDPERMVAALDDPFILFCAGTISNLAVLLPLLEAVAREMKPLLVVAQEVEGEALATLVVNKLRGTLLGVAVKAPGFGDRRRAMLEDMAAVTAARVIDEDTGASLDGATLSDLGRARRVVITKDDTLLVEGAGAEAAIRGRAAYIEAQIQGTQGYEREKLEERLTKLLGRAAVIRVGAATETEMLQKLARTQDALHALRAAMEEGIVPGGGVALLRGQAALDHLNAVGERALGVDIVRRAIEEPIRQIITNAGEEPDPIIRTVREGPATWGYHAASAKYGDLLAEGIIDPVKVVRSVLQDAAHVAGLMLTRP